MQGRDLEPDLVGAGKLALCVELESASVCSSGEGRGRRTSVPEFTLEVRPLCASVKEVRRDSDGRGCDAVVAHQPCDALDERNGQSTVLLAGWC